MAFRSGRHFLQLPGPTNVPDRVLRAMDRPTIDHRGPDFPALTRQVLDGLRMVYKTKGRVFVFPASGSGAWEATLVNTLSPGDRILAFDHGQFATGWKNVAIRLGLDVDFVPSDWRRAVDPFVVQEKLASDAKREYKAVLIIHNETSTGVTTDVSASRGVMDRLEHPACLFVDAVSSLASIDYRHDDWRVDVTVSGSQKGMMLPPGLAFTAVSDRAYAAMDSARLPRSYWDWREMEAFNKDGFFPYTPATNLLFGLREALAMFREEGLDAVFARHARLAEATRRAVCAWGLRPYGSEPSEWSNTVTTVAVPEGVDADALRRTILDHFDMSLGTGLGKLKGKVFRIGHLGDFNALMLAGTLCGIEMGLSLQGLAPKQSGVTAALDYITATASADVAQ